MKSKVALSVMLTLLLCAGHAVAYLEWDGGATENNLWSDPNNWVGEVLPAAADEARIKYISCDPAGWPNTPDPDGPVIDGFDAICQKLTFRHETTGEDYASLIIRSGSLRTYSGNCIVGRNARGVLFMEGGEFYAEDELYISDRGGEGYLIMSGGVIDTVGGYDVGGGNTASGGHLIVAGKTVVTGKNNVGTIEISGGSIITKNIVLGEGGVSQAAINMTDGLISNVGAASSSSPRTLTIAKAAGSTAHFQLDGGIIEVQVFAFGAGTGSMDITGGTLKIMGDQTSLINGYLSEGKITGYGSTDPRFVQVVYDSESDFTIVTAVEANPNKAYNPSPATPADFDAPLSWASGDDVVSEVLYLSTDSSLVEAGDASVMYTGVSSPVDIQTLLPEGFEFDTDYYWKVDSTDSTSTVNVGDVWSFHTRAAVVLDRFDHYADLAALQAVWPDANSLSSDPAADVYSMQFDYDASAAPYKTVITTNISNYNDWTIKDLKVLRMRFFGNNLNSAATASVEIENASGQKSAVTYDGDMEELARSSSWTAWEVPLADFGIDLTNVTKLSFIFGDGLAAGGAGGLYVDDITLFPARCVSEFGPAGDVTGDCVVNLADVSVLAADWLKVGASYSASDPGGADLGWWKLDETAGLSCTDSAGANAGVLNNFPTDDSQWVAGKDGNALLFDGLDDYVLLNSDYVYGDINDSGAVAGTTWSCWIKTTSWNSQVIMGVFDDQANAGALTDNRGGKVLYTNREGFLVAYARGVSDPDPSIVRVNDGQWHHVALTAEFNASEATDNITLYLDGVNVSSLLTNYEQYNATYPQTKVLALGPAVLELTDRTIFDRKAFDGTIDDVRIYNRALTPAEIVSLAGLAQIAQPVDSAADIVDDEIINVDDLKLMGSDWLKVQYYPAN